MSQMESEFKLIGGVTIGDLAMFLRFGAQSVGLEVFLDHIESRTNESILALPVDQFERLLASICEQVKTEAEEVSESMELTAIVQGLFGGVGKEKEL